MRLEIRVLALAGLGAAFAFTAVAAGDLSGGLTGQWRLNSAESEDARAKMAEARQRSGGSDDRMGGHGPGGPGGGHHGGYGGHHGGSGDGRGGSDRSMGAFGGFLDPAESLTITGTDAELTLDDGNGALARITVDGQAHQAEGGGRQTTARWKGPALEVESRSDSGATITTTYTPVPESHRLEVVAKLSGRRGEVSVRRVYDAAPPAS